MKIPCKDCILFARCNSHFYSYDPTWQLVPDHILKCEVLQKYTEKRYKRSEYRKMTISLIHVRNFFRPDLKNPFRRFQYGK